MKVNWSGRGLAYTEEEIMTVARVMAEADPLTQGHYQVEFEDAFKDYCGANHAFAVSSCTAALELSALLSGIGPGDEVILPAHTFAATAIPFARTGAKLIWADINPSTRVITAQTIEPLITSSTKVVVVVHLYGLMCDMDPIMGLATRHGFLVIEDAAQAAGAQYKGRRAGAIGDFGCFSFHTHKNISTLGEGGMLTMKSDAFAVLTPGLRHNGMRPYRGERAHYWIPAMSNVDFDVEGLWPYNFCIGEVQCALGTQLIRRLDVINSERANRAKRFIEAFRDYPELVFQSQPDGCGHAWHLMAVRYDGAEYGATRDDLLALLAYTYGIKTVVQYHPLYRYPMFKKAGFGVANCPETDKFFDNMVSFPFHHWMSDGEFATMIDMTRQALDQLREGNMQ
ncbi:MAG: DegT/DnrJ/EryC1/StrS family aminotransferase [Alphaproteobacteria bacterium]|nr:DegT/DnrJ/EryC1/StrS family aminotransferase [Alphaproteobacteria bacterium]